jgi:hypothetical protein
MWQQVAQHVKDCDLCQRARVSFNQQLHVLHSLPFEGMFYRWGVDLAGPFGVGALSPSPWFKSNVIAASNIIKG